MLAFVRGEHDVPGCDDDHRVGARHPERQHADRRAGRPARPGAGVPDPRPRRPKPRARLRVPALPLAGGAQRRRRGPPRDPLRQHRAGLGLPRGDARPRDPRRGQPARRRAVGPRRGGRLRALLPDARGRGRGDARGRCGGRGTASRGSPFGSTWTSTPTCRPSTCPSRRPRSTSTAAWRPPRTAGSSGPCGRSSRTASARSLSRSPTCSTCSACGSSWATRAPARSSSARVACASRPIELDSDQVAALREPLPEVDLPVAGEGARGPGAR